MKLYCPSCKSPVADNSALHCTVCFYACPSDGWPSEDGAADPPLAVSASPSRSSGRRRTATVVEASNVTSDINEIVSKHVSADADDPWGVDLNKGSGAGWPASTPSLDAQPAAAPPPPSEPPSPQPAAPVPPPPEPGDAEMGQKPGSNKGLIIGAVVAGVFLFCCCPSSIGGYFYFVNSDTASKPKKKKKAPKKKKKKKKKKSKKSSSLKVPVAPQADPMDTRDLAPTWASERAQGGWTLGGASVG